MSRPRGLAHRTLLGALTLTLALSGCDDGASADPAVDGAVSRQDAGDGARPLDAFVGDATGADMRRPDPADAAPPLDDLGPAEDAGPTPPDAEPDAGPPDPAWFPPAPAPYRVGAAARRLPIPVGIGTSGFGFNQGGESKTPYAQLYPGTTGLHTHPDIRAVVVEAGEGNRLYLLRTDTIGMTGAMRQALVERLTSRYGPDVDHQLIAAATHTHAGPGRLLDKPYWHLIQDHFFPEMYVRVVDAFEETVVAAVEDLEPATIAHGRATSDLLHRDRRCANPDESEPDLAFTAARRVEDGSLKALLLFHSLHPTVIGMRELLLSQDATGGIEEQVAARLSDPALVIFFNGNAADLGPGPGADVQVDGAAPWPDNLTRIERIGHAAGDAIEMSLGDADGAAEGVIHSRTVRLPINRDLLGYVDREFPYENGAVYCGAGSAEACFGEDPPNPRALGVCVPFPEEAAAAPKQVPVTAARIGDRWIITTPGEFSVALGRRIREGLGAPARDAVIVGYAQEYTGYSLPEEDWWMGGYEASGALWGPRQGDYLANGILEVGLRLLDPNHRLPFREPAADPAPGPYDPPAREALRSARGPDIASDLPNAAEPGDALSFAFHGGDPWLGTPLVTLERQSGRRWEPATTPDGRVVTSDGPRMTLHLEPDPPYTEEAEARRFRWTVRLPARHPGAVGPDLTGETWRLVARGRMQGPNQPNPTEYTITSRELRVRPR